MNTRKHFLVPSDHRDQNSVAKRLKLVILHLQARSYRQQRNITLFLWQQRQIPTELTKLKGMIYLVDRSVGVIE